VLDHFCRYGRDASAHPEQQAGIDELPRPEPVILVVEGGLQPERRSDYR
jgi:hypothetical protein